MTGLSTPEGLVDRLHTTLFRALFPALKLHLGFRTLFREPARTPGREMILKDVPPAVGAPAEAPERLLELRGGGGDAIIHSDFLSSANEAFGLEDNSLLPQLNLQRGIHAPMVHTPAKDKPEISQ